MIIADDLLSHILSCRNLLKLIQTVHSAATPLDRHCSSSQNQLHHQFGDLFIEQSYPPVLKNLLHARKHIRELKQQRQRRLRKRHSKSAVALIETLSRLFHLIYFVKCWYQSLGKEKESCCLVFPSSTKHEFKHYVVVEQRR